MNTFRNSERKVKEDRQFANEIIQERFVKGHAYLSNYCTIPQRMKKFCDFEKQENNKNKNKKSGIGIF